MLKAKVLCILFLFLLGNKNIFSQEIIQENVFNSALEEIAKLNLEKAYGMLENVENNFPQSEEAEKSRVLKAAISATLYDTYRYFSFFKYFTWRYHGKKKKTFIKIREEIMSKEIIWKKKLIACVSDLLFFENKNVELTIKKNFIHLQLLKSATKAKKKLIKGKLLSLKEIEAIKNYKVEEKLSVFVGAFIGRVSYFSSDDAALVRWTNRWENIPQVQGKFDFVKGLFLLTNSIDIEKEKDKKTVAIVKSAAEKIMQLLKMKKEDPYYEMAADKVKKAEIVLKNL